MKRVSIGFVVTVLASALVWLAAGCGKPLIREPEKLRAQTIRVQTVGASSRGSGPGYIGIVRADTETDFSFKVPGILEFIGPESGGDWKEGAMQGAGKVLARLNQADFNNEFASASAREALTKETYARLLKLRSTEAISQQELDIAKADAEAPRPSWIRRNRTEGIRCCWPPSTGSC